MFIFDPALFPKILCKGGFTSQEVTYEAKHGNATL